MPPELVCMHGTVPAHAADADSRTVSAVHGQQIKNGLRAGRPFFAHAQIQVNAVGMIINSQNLLGYSADMEIGGQIDYTVNRGPALLGVQVFVPQLTAPAGINKMIKQTRGIFSFSSSLKMPEISPTLRLLMVKRSPTLTPALMQLRIPCSARSKAPLTPRNRSLTARIPSRLTPT